MLVADARAGDEWILVLVCSYHMRPNRDWFTTYQLVNGGIVLMGKKMSYKIEWWQYRPLMHDGAERILTDAFSRIEEKPYIFWVLLTPQDVGIQLKVESWGYERRSCCYEGKRKFIGFVCFRVAQLQVLQQSLQQTIQISIRLWHMRLGRLSERGMTVLIKQGLFCGWKIGKLDFC